MNDLKTIASEVLSRLKSAGADKASAIVKSSETREFNVDNGKFSLFRTLFNNGITMTAIKDSKKGSMALNRYDSDSSAETEAQCVAIAEIGQPDEAWDFSPQSDNQTFTSGVAEGDIDLLFERTNELVSDIAARHPLIHIEQLVVDYVKSTRVYANTYGVEFEEIEGMYSVMLMYSAHEGSLSSSFYDSSFTLSSLDKPFIECANVEQDLSNIEKQIRTESSGEKFIGTALLPPSTFAVLLSSALSNFAGDMPILDGTSIWRDSIGKTVASEKLTVKVDPFDESIVCGERVTSDGFISKPYDVIKSGVLNSFMLSLYVSNKTGIERAKNSSGNIVVDGGEKSLEEIISKIDRGIFVGRISAGQPAANGDFSGIAKNSFLIENGKITKALSETMISGNIADMLRNIVDLSSERVADGDTLIPYAAVGGVVVSGK